jgi:predicted nucleic acid-binding protein
VERVLTQELGFSQRLAFLTRRRIVRRSTVVAPRASRHQVPGDPDDSPILQAALAGGIDYLVTNDRHLLEISPYEGLQAISMTVYYQLLVQHGFLE